MLSFQRNLQAAREVFRQRLGRRRGDMASGEQEMSRCTIFCPAFSHFLPILLFALSGYIPSSNPMALTPLLS